MIRPIQSVQTLAGCSFGQRAQCHPRRRMHMATKWDKIPALFTNEDAFWERSYWDARYQQDPTTFEWYRSYSSLQPILTEHLPKVQPILQLGVGTSRLQVDMADDGYSHITSIDYSPVAIQRLEQLYPGYETRLFYAVADARNMPQYADESFQGILDKGTLDALLCGDTEAADSAALLSEVWRLLTPGSAYVMITSAAPKARLKYLQTPATRWSRVLVYEVGQQGAMTGPFHCTYTNTSSSNTKQATSNCAEDASSSSVVTGASTSSSSRGQREGVEVSAAAEVQGVEAEQLQLAMQLPKMGYSHMVYVCYK